MTDRFRRLVRVTHPSVLLVAMLSLSTSLLSQVLGYLVSQAPISQTLPLLTLSSLTLGLVFLWLAPKAEPSTSIQTVILRTPEEQRRYAHRGLIVFVSLYHPVGGIPPAGPTQTDWREAAQALAIERLDLPHSSLAPAIAAVLSHASRLEHCWLISTISTDERQPGSLLSVPLVVEYLRRQGVTYSFHMGREYAVALDNDALVCTKTYDLIRRIYQEAADRDGLNAPDLVADFTGCPRSMSVGLILASLHADRNVQLISTRYDAAGRPTGSVFPIIVSYETVAPLQRPAP
jgi:hypothetical protein